MPARGWQRISGELPEAWVMLWDDAVSRIGNRVAFTLNVSARVGTRWNNAWWDYPWFVDVYATSVTQVNTGRRLIKPLTAPKRNIRNNEFYMSAYSGHFHGAVDVNKDSTTIHVQIFFSDSKGNRGGPVHYWIPIPWASAPWGMGSSVVDVEDTTASVNVWCQHAGHYAKVVKWDFDYGTTSNYGQHIDWNTHEWSNRFNLANLQDGTTYYYRSRVFTDIGFVNHVTGSFRTQDRLLGKRLEVDQPEKFIKAVIIYPDGTRKSVKEVKAVK